MNRWKRLMGFTCSGFLCFASLAALATRPSAGHVARQKDAALTRYQYTQLHMGVQVRITLFAPDRPAAERAAEAGFRRFAELEDVMSDYRPTSELMRLCAKAGGPAVPVSPDLFRVLERAQEVARRSGGAFDVTLGPLIQLWRVSRRNGVLPTAEQLAEAKSRSGWRRLLLNKRERSARLLVPGMRLDLGGIAKGYAGDEAVAAMKRSGVGRAMVEAGGDIVASGPPPGQRGWRIALENPGAAPPVLEAANAAVSTSGDTAQFVEIGGKRYSHVVDPATGLGLTSRTEVTVLARDGLTSDSLSTAVSILGPERGRRLVGRYGGARAYIRRGGAVSEMSRPSMREHLGRGGAASVRYSQ
jgi:thiamine biosynthesis lipoprotein